MAVIIRNKIFIFELCTVFFTGNNTKKYFLIDKI